MQGLRAIIVEDEALLAMELERTLESMGIILAGTALTRNEAELLAADAAADLALIDWDLAGRNADDLVQSCLARGMAVVVCSGTPPEQLGEPGEDGEPHACCGCTFLPKPYGDAAIEAALLRALRSLQP